MNKEIDNLTMEDAQLIYAHPKVPMMPPGKYGQDLKAHIRAFLRANKLTPAQAISSIPKAKAF